MSPSTYHPLHISSSQDKSHTDDSPATRGGIKAWLMTVWPLALHSVTAVAIALQLVRFVDNADFGITNRQPYLPLAYGRSRESAHYILLQSDIMTVLSSAIVLLRWILAAWSIPFCWHSALYLMSKRGLPHRELKTLIGLGALKPNYSWEHSDKALIGAALFLNLVASSTAPLLTGSVSWLPSNRLYSLEPHAPQLNISYVDTSSTFWPYYMSDVVYRRTLLQIALGHVTLGWGREIDRNLLKRTIRSANGLQTGSTLASLTLPYFSVDHIEWLNHLPNNSTVDSLCDQLIDMAHSGPLEPGDFRLNPGYSGLIPGTRWSSDANRPFPSPKLIRKTQLVILNLGPARASRMSFSGPPLPLKYTSKGTLQYGFALVNYTAGAAHCQNCSISSPSTVHSIKSRLSPVGHPMAEEALSLAPPLLSAIVDMNSSIPLPANCSLDDYVTALLTRSYVAAWSTLTDMDSDLSLSTTYSPATPTLKAQVDTIRVYIWLSFQLLVTLTGVCFLGIHARSGNQPIGDTTLTGFYLDTSDVPVSGRSPVFKQGGVLRLRPKGSRLKVEVQGD
ncbi:hypothetical protein B0J17DRAFT_772972 [Rhizoctonia solani]|nr:hypothetical protein B0J17DRAFT_772972 [Rhizoctonia solani]